MIGEYLPGAVWRPVSYRLDAGRFPARPFGWLMHVVQGNGSPFNTFENAPAGKRKFSTGWIAKAGSSEQYAELSCMPWAQEDGNPRYWAFEFEGFTGEPLTAEQIHTAALWHNFTGTADALAEADYGTGVGTHYMGGASFGGHTCPDAVPGAGPRSHQRQAIIELARTLRGQSPPIPPPAPTPIIPNSGGLTMQTIDLGPGKTVTGPGVQPMQRLLGGLVVDGQAGPSTRARLGTVQLRMFKTADFAFGPVTASALLAGR